MNKYIRALAGIALSATMAVNAAAVNMNIGHNKSRQQTTIAMDEYHVIQLYDSAELSGGMLRHRNGDIIIEKVIGRCMNNKGKGKVLNAYNPNHDYISYRGCRGVKKGDIVLTYLVYSPDTNCIDDVAIRSDYVIENIPVKEQVNINLF